MKKPNKLNLLEGAVVGMILGVAAGIFLQSKKGKEIQENVKHTVADFYKNVAPKIKKMKKLGKEEYDVFMKSAVENYGKARKMSAEKIKELMTEVKKSWNHLQKHSGK